MKQCKYKTIKINDMCVIFIPKEDKLIEKNNAYICPKCGEFKLK